MRLTLHNKQVAYMVFMPFIENGGIFIPTEHNNILGDKIEVVLNIPEIDKEIIFTGPVVWITPSTSLSKQGIGVQFQGEKGNQARTVLETYLAGVNYNKRTYTL